MLMLVLAPEAYNNIEDNTTDYSINRSPLNVGNGTAILKHLSASAALDFGNIATQVSA